MPGNVVAGTVDFIEPGIQAGSRTLRVRIALANPTGALRPNLPGQVTIATGEGKQSLTVPLSAVIDSGRRQAVLLARDGGRFVPRKVVTGRRDDERVEILEGLLEGDEVVVSANFLIDAESNLRQALDGMQAPDEAAGEHAGHGG
jgi:Cu(I)/Ag(I) efflux system membrane fusion protein